MDNSKILKELLVLRNYHKAGLEATDRLIEELEKNQEPQNPRKRRNLKNDRIAKYENYFMSGKFKSSKNMLKQALERHDI